MINEIINNLDKDKKYKCIYGVHKETYNICKDYISGCDISGNYQRFYFAHSLRENETLIDNEHIHSIFECLPIYMR